MSATPFDHPFLSGLLGDPEIAALLTAESDIEHKTAIVHSRENRFNQQPIHPDHPGHFTCNGLDVASE